MTSSPRISIIIACLNQARYLEQTLCSVIDQAYDNLELIVCDGGSTDDTPRLLQRYANEITRAGCEADCGPGEGLNRGLH